MTGNEFMDSLIFPKPSAPPTQKYHEMVNMFQSFSRDFTVEPNDPALLVW